MWPPRGYPVPADGPTPMYILAVLSGLHRLKREKRKEKVREHMKFEEMVVGTGELGRTGWEVGLVKTQYMHV